MIADTQPSSEEVDALICALLNSGDLQVDGTMTDSARAQLAAIHVRLLHTEQM